jgi:hypothetical protein
MVAIRFLEAKLQLYTYGLQDEMMCASPVDLLSCYTSSIRMLEILQKLSATPATGAAYWPRSILLSSVYAIVSIRQRSRTNANAINGLLALSPEACVFTDNPSAEVYH